MADRVLIAGGAGFIGTHLAEALLADGHEVVVLDSLLTGSIQNVNRLSGNPKYSFVRSDVTHPIPPLGRVDRIFNLACAASPAHYQADPVHTLTTSVVGTHNLLALAERSGARFLMASTSEVYGDPERHPQTEDYFGNVNPNGPRACYDEGKRAAETLCSDYLRADRADVRIARIFNTYGPYMRADDGRVVSNAICQALSGDNITVYGDGSQTRSFCYASDLVAGLRRLMDHPEPIATPVNLGNPDEITIMELLESVLGEIETRSKVVYQPLPQDDPQRRRPDIARAKAILGWEPKVKLPEGLRQTIRWFAGVTRRDQLARTA
jgi:UDP-glucuronate decarboxylase